MLKTDLNLTLLITISFLDKKPINTQIPTEKPSFIGFKILPFKIHLILKAFFIKDQLNL